MEAKSKVDNETGSLNGVLGSRFDLKTSKRLYLSKVYAMDECPRRYFWIHYYHIQTKKKNDKMVWGADFHSHSDTLLNKGFGEAAVEIQNRGYDEKKLEDLGYCVSLLNDKLKEEGLEEVLAVEEATPIKLDGPYFEEWMTKSDAVAVFKGRLWNVEYKTTSGYGSATAAFYHNSMQTLTYFKNMKEKHPEVVGTKLFVIVRTKVPRIEVENIVVTKEQLRRADIFIDDAHRYAEALEFTREFRQKQTKCIEVKSGECPYYPICFSQDDKYIKQWIEELYDVRDPDEHLNIQEEP